MLWLQHDLLNRHHDMPNFHRDELFLQHDLNGRNTIYFFMHKTALACHIFRYKSFNFSFETPYFGRLGVFGGSGNITYGVYLTMNLLTMLHVYIISVIQAIH